MMALRRPGLVLALLLTLSGAGLGACGQMGPLSLPGAPAAGDAAAPMPAGDDGDNADDNDEADDER